MSSRPSPALRNRSGRAARRWRRRLAGHLAQALLAGIAVSTSTLSASAGASLDGATGGTSPFTARIGPDDGATWPLQPRPSVIAPFQPPHNPYGAGHRGVDLLGQVGQNVRAAKAGTVTFAGPLAGKGVIVVDHGELRTTYEPVAALVSVGDHVEMGQIVGRLEFHHSHCVPQACLHWGLKRGDTYLDPLTLLGPRPVRLYPLASSASQSAGSLAFAANYARGWAIL